jgi:H+/Cl- antiporter ClcA
MYIIIIALVIGFVFFSFQTISSIVFDLNNFTANKYDNTKKWFVLLTIINIFLFVSILLFYHIYKTYELKGNKGPQGYQGDKGIPGDNVTSCTNRCNSY